jgi:NAD(P)-dependent dehydrogenase (short-subunit alcohol dehydrogenase family)
MKNEISLEGKVALVTGGATGLGFGIAAELQDCGARVILAGRREALLEEACRRLLGASWVRMDLADAASLPETVEALYRTHPTIDILVNNAGIQNNKPALEFTDGEVQALFATNVFGTFALTREIARRMTERKTGSIVFITSSAVHMGLAKNLAYSGSKGALSSMVRALASELSPLGVRVNAVAPGWIETELVKESLRRIPERRQKVEGRSMLGRLGTPKDIGMAVAFLASDAAAYITAAELRVDGGVSVSL